MADDLTCNEAAEYVSALADGELVPAEAAKHIGACAMCQVRLHDYMAMGAELRRFASLAAAQPALPLFLERSSRSKTSIWQRGWETMRIPKFAFALLVIAVLALASSLAVVRVGAHSSGSVLLLRLSSPGRDVFPCAIDTTRKGADHCAVIAPMNQHLTGVQLEFIARDGDRVQLGVRTKSVPLAVLASQSMGTGELANEPQSSYSFEPGEALKLNVQGVGSIDVRGEWTDHMPALVSENNLDPGPTELRLVSPMLLRDKQVLGDMEGGTATAKQAETAIFVYLPETGRYLVSLAPMKGAVQGTVQLNRIKFQIEGQTYVFLTGAPVTRGDKVWVLYEPDFKPKDSLEAGFIGSGVLNRIAPEAVMADLPGK
jgi:hypothetical protein